MNQHLFMIIMFKLAAGAVLVLGTMSFAVVAHGAPPAATTRRCSIPAMPWRRALLSDRGCHEKNATLMTGYKASYMTHAMVKCNACHGTHTAAELGKPKPNLTGYISGMGATGYKVPRTDAWYATVQPAGKGIRTIRGVPELHAPHKSHAEKSHSAKIPAATRRLFIHNGSRCKSFIAWIFFSEFYIRASSGWLCCIFEAAEYLSPCDIYY